MLRRRLTWILAAAVTAGLATSPALAGKKDDTLVWSTDRENPIADPYFINTRELVVVGHYVWDTLVFNDPAKTEIKPLLATSWKWANDTTLEMELRTDVKFHSGKTTGCRRCRLHAEFRLQQGPRDHELRLDGVDQERGEDRCEQGAHQPA